MTRSRRATLRWLLSGGAFVVVIAAAGCSGSKPVSQASLYESAPRPPEVAISGPEAEPQMMHPVLEVGQPEAAAPPKVNIFGEFDGLPRPMPKNSTAVSFQQHTFIDDGFDGDVSVDPKGEWLVFSSTRHSEHADLYLQKVDGVSVTQLTSDDADDAFPVFSPDGKKIAFCSTRSGNWDIYVMDVDGKNVVQATSSPLQEIHPSFSPDGTRLVYCAQGSRNSNWEIWTVNLTTNERKMIGNGLFPTWSPRKDKDQIAFQKARARGSRWFSLWTLDVVDGEARMVTEVAVSSNAAIVSPSWSPDGARLSFSTIVEPAKGEAGKPGGQQDIWTVNADGTNRHRITDGNGTSATPFWASNDRIFFVSNRSGADCIWSARAEGTPTATATVKTDTKELEN